MPSVGGPVTNLVGLSAAQLSQGLTCGVLTCQPEDDVIPVYEEWTTLAPRLHNVPAYPFANQPILFGRKDIEEVVAGYDVVHIHMLWEHLHYQVAKACVRLGKPYVVTPCGLLLRYSMGKKHLKKALYWQLFGKYITDHAEVINFRTAIEQKDSYVSFPEGKVYILPAGISLPDEPDCGDRSGSGYLVTIGRIHPKKNIEAAIEALSQAKSYKGMLKIIGEGEPSYVASLKDLAKKLGVNDRVSFEGAIYGSEKFVALAGADACVLPSYSENFGSVVIESLAVGTPVICSDQIALAAFVEKHKLGTTLPVSRDAFSKAIDQLPIEEDRMTFRRRARSLVSEQYNWQSIAAKFGKLYESLLRSSVNQ